MGTNYNITPALVKLVVKVVGGIVAFCSNGFCPSMV